MMLENNLEGLIIQVGSYCELLSQNKEKVGKFVDRRQASRRVL
jgi:hypothetical protein